MGFCPADGPIGGEQEQAVAFHVLHSLGVAGQVEVTQVVGVRVVLDPAQLLERELLQAMELAARELQDYKTAYECAARQLKL